MCGIWLEVLAAAIKNAEHQHQNNEENKNLSRRGPDHVGSVKCCHDNHEIQLQASVLKMRSHSTLQPVPLSQGEDSSMHLAWNGEVYQMQSTDDVEETVAGYDIADTQLVADLLVKMHARMREEHGNNNTFLDAFAACLANNVIG